MSLAGERKLARRSEGRTRSSPRRGRAHTADDNTATPRWSAARGSALRHRRRWLGFTVAEVAAEIGVSDNTVRSWEKGGSHPTEENLESLDRVIGLRYEPSFRRRRNDPTRWRPALAGELYTRRVVLAITQARVAARLGVAQATYAGWEIGRTTPRLHFARALAAFLGRPTGQLERQLRAPLLDERATSSALGRRIRSGRVRLGLSQQGLGAKVGVKAKTIGRWERGEARPRARNEARLWSALENAAKAEDFPVLPAGGAGGATRRCHE